MSDTQSSLEEYIDSFPWESLSHAYGSAGDAPHAFRRLISLDDEIRSDAINGFLFSSVFHQYTLYSSSSFSILVVIQILKDGRVNELASSNLGDPMPTELLGFIYACAEECVEPEPPDEIAGYLTVRNAVLSGISLYRSFLEHDHSAVRNEAKKLVDWASRH